MNLILAVFFGGGLGAVARHYTVAGLSGASGTFPYGTLAVNVIGSFIIGALMEIMALKWQVSQEVRALMITGFLGGFTTFSAFSFDFLKLVETNQYMPAALYAGLSVALSLAAVFAGAGLFRGVLSW